MEIRQTEIYRKWFSGLRDGAARARIDIRIKSSQATDIANAIALANCL